MSGCGFYIKLALVERLFPLEPEVFVLCAREALLDWQAYPAI